MPMSKGGLHMSKGGLHMSKGGFSLSFYISGSDRFLTYFQLGPCTPVLPATPHTPGSGMITTPPRNSNPSSSSQQPMMQHQHQQHQQHQHQQQMQPLPSMQQITGGMQQQQQQQQQQLGGGDFNLDDLNFDPSAIIGDSGDADLNVSTLHPSMCLLKQETHGRD
jgi:hypothetical protein